MHTGEAVQALEASLQTIIEPRGERPTPAGFDITRHDAKPLIVD